MTEVTRRALLTGAAAAAAAPLVTSLPAGAAAPPAGAQAPGWYRYKVGSFEITVVTDGMGRFKVPDNFVGNVSKDEIGQGARRCLSPKRTRWRRRTIRSS